MHLLPHFNSKLSNYGYIILLVCATVGNTQDKWISHGTFAAENRINTGCKNNPLKCLMDSASSLSFQHKRSPLYYKGHPLCNPGDYNCELCVESLYISPQQTALSELEWNSLTQCIDEIYSNTRNNDYSELESNADVSDENAKSKREKKTILSNQVTNAIISLCPSGMEKLHCFENYMSMWLHTVVSDQRKRNLFVPGRKRAGLLGPRKHSNKILDSFRMLIDLCPPGIDQVQCYDKILSLFVSLKARSGYKHNRNRKTREEEENFEKKLIKSLNEECQSSNEKLSCVSKSLKLRLESSEDTEHPLSHQPSQDTHLIRQSRGNKRVTDLCPGGVEQVNCYEHYLRSLVSNSQNRMRGGNEFIGKAK